MNSKEFFSLFRHKIQVQFKDVDTFKKVISNFLWLFFDKFFRMGVGLVVGVWIARYLGPETFGYWNYAISFVSLWFALVSLSVETITVREIVRNPEEAPKRLGSMFVMRLVSSLFVFLVSTLCIHLQRNDLTLTWIAAITSFGFVFQSLDTIDYYFKAKMLNSYTVRVKNIAFLLLSIIRVGLIMQGAGVMAFVYAAFAETALGCIFLVYVYVRNGHQLTDWRFDWAICKATLGESWLLILAQIASSAYSRLDQVMIGEMLDNKQLALYAVSMKLYEIPISIALMLPPLLFAKLTELYQRSEETFYTQFYKLNSLITMGGIGIAALALIFGEYTIQLVYGEKYYGVHAIFMIHMIGNIIQYNGCLRSSYIAIRSLHKVIFIATFISSVCSAMLNYFVIPMYGVIGAAWVGVCTQCMSLFLSNLFFTETKMLFWIQVKSFFPLDMLLKVRR